MKKKKTYEPPRVRMVPQELTFNLLVASVTQGERQNYGDANSLDNGINRSGYGSQFDLNNSIDRNGYGDAISLD